MTESPLIKRMKNGQSYEIHPCIDPSIHFTREALKEEIRKALKSMSVESLWHRFARGTNELTEKQLDYLTNIDGIDHVAWCAALFNKGNITGMGLARYIRQIDNPETAEFAITIIDQFQSKGVGRALLAQLTESARENSIRTLRGYVLPDNKIMLSFAKSLHASIQPEENFMRVDLTVD